MMRQPYLLIPEQAVAFMLQQFGGEVRPPRFEGGLCQWNPPHGTKVYEACVESSDHHFKVTEVVRTPDDAEWVVIHLSIEGEPDLWRVYDPQGHTCYEVEFHHW